ncbi:uncharacterized protein BXZ73DRAFT_100187 [Epithele typhae]|uniref:uncharacterized protein n=1 Tax=Epithele typhae TaxID=378194 RepID=UPI0020073F0E|nr:uncharacterized protein BXZ73DRAFT_100187 [Epithele typhae]KAH9936765.1 hypothetical protein BXZ73DRAFT_100187 [Epithele typhae]
MSSSDDVTISHLMQTNRCLDTKGARYLLGDDDYTLEIYENDALIGFASPRYTSTSPTSTPTTSPTPTVALASFIFSPARVRDLIFPASIPPSSSTSRATRSASTQGVVSCFFFTSLDIPNLAVTRDRSLTLTPAIETRQSWHHISV